MFPDGQISRARPFGVPAIIVLVLAGIVVAYVAILPRVAKRNRKLLRLPIAQRYNDITRKSAGSQRSPFALLIHVGRRSGRTYTTALGACAYGDGFILPLGYGTQTDWCRNVMAAGTGELAWKGRTYQLDRPELVSGPQVMRAWSLRQRTTLQLAGIHDFLWLHQRQTVTA